jgi:uncharacterized protein
MGVDLESATIYPGPPQNDAAGAAQTMFALIEKHNVVAVAIGNGTGSREAFAFAKDALANAGKSDVMTVFVNESGASIYSASKLAREEFPDLDVTIRGAISIARRLQDPMSELVKIEPRSIGVGQYQHDVNQKHLKESLTRTVVSCVSRVGVELNTASVELLRYVNGIQMGTAQNIVEFRTKANGLTSREQLKEVNGIGPKTFEQCAGFLRIRGAENPLDSTSIHPEAYPIVEKMAAHLETTVAELIAKPSLLDAVDLAQFTTDTIGLLTLADIKEELRKPGRDPRAEFRMPHFLEGVTKPEQLEEGMMMEGVVTNVTDFGAFVDIGVHQDGLVHLSELANRYVEDPREFIKVGAIVKVKVIKVDKAKNRISLSMKAAQPPRKPRADRPQRPRTEDGKPGEGTRPPSDRPYRPRPDRSATAPTPPVQGDAAPVKEGVRRERTGDDAKRREYQRTHTEEGFRKPARKATPEDAPRDQQRGTRRRDDSDRSSSRDDRNKRPRKPDNGAASVLKHSDQSGSPLNTLLADQLAALKNKFGQ